jgi:hypothetical protein
MTDHGGVLDPRASYSASSVPMARQPLAADGSVPLRPSTRLMSLALALAVLAAVLCAWSASMAPHSSRPANAASRITTPGLAPDHFTTQHLLLDYGITSATLAAAVAVVARRRVWPVPATRAALGVLAAAAPLATLGATLYGAALNTSRAIHAPWAAVGSVPVLGLASIVSALALWALGHMTLLVGARLQPGLALSVDALRTGNRWLLLVCAITVVNIVGVALAGYYWMLLPGFLWLYFYAAIAAVRHANGHDAF